MGSGGAGGVEEQYLVNHGTTRTPLFLIGNACHSE